MDIPVSPGEAAHEFAVMAWNAMTQDDVGAAIPVVSYQSATAQVTGERSGARVVLEGRIASEGKFLALEDAEGFAAQVGDKKLCRIPQLGATELRPRVSGGNAQTKLNVTVLLKR